MGAIYSKMYLCYNIFNQREGCMDIEKIRITPKDDIGKKLAEAKELSDFNNMPVLIELTEGDKKPRKQDKAYLVSRDYFAEVIGRIYKTNPGNSASSFDNEYPDEQDNPDYNRLKRIINSLYENSYGSVISTESISNPKAVNVDIELFPAIDSPSSLAETIYLDESGQLDDISIEEQIFLDNGLYNYFQFTQAPYNFAPKSKTVRDQLDEYKSAKNGKSSLKRIDLIESKLVVNPMYKEQHFEKLVGRYKGLLSRRINGKDRYVYGVIKDQRQLVVHSVRGHYD